MKKITFILAAMLCVLTGYAQRATISPKSGYLISALTGSQEVGFQNGFGSVWYHKLVSLRLQCSDDPGEKATGIIQTPANNFYYNGDVLQYACNTSDGNAYMMLTLPKGYKINGYTIKFNCGSDKVNSLAVSRVNPYWYLREVKSDFSTVVKECKFYAGTASDTTHVLTRSSTANAEMNNILYFQLKCNNDANNMGAINITYFEVTYSVDGKVPVEMVPTSASATGVDYTQAEVNTEKLVLGEVSANTKSGNTYYSFKADSVKYVPAYMNLYESDAVEDGVLGAKEGSKGISSSKIDDNYYYTLKPGNSNYDYYIEAPVETNWTNGGQARTAYFYYRLTGATLNYKYSNLVTVEDQSNGFYITYTDNNTTYYLYASANNQAVGRTTYQSYASKWFIDEDGYIYTQVMGTYSTTTYYLCYNTSTVGSNYAKLYTQRNTSTKNRVYVKGAYDDDTRRLTLNGYYICYDRGTDLSTGTGSQSNWGVYVRSALTSYGSYCLVSYPSSQVEGGNVPYTLTVYDKDGTTVLKQVEVSESNSEGSITVDGFNNDALKFNISGSDDARAHLTFSPVIEPLNPYVDYTNVQGVTDKPGKYSVHLAATDFTFGMSTGVTFGIPQDDGSDECEFVFNELNSKYGDSSYPYGYNGDARYYYVESEYEQEYELNPYKDRAAAADDSKASEKTATVRAGRQGYKFNNAGDLDKSNTGSSSQYLEEYRFDKKDYESNYGGFGEVKLRVSGNGGNTRSKFVLKNDDGTESESDSIFLFTADETKYNIAPTTSTPHVQVLEYNLYLSATTADGTIELEWVKPYADDQYLYQIPGTLSNSEEPFAGVAVYNSGSVTSAAVYDSIKASIARGDANAPIDLAHVLFVDLSLTTNLVIDVAGDEEATSEDQKSLQELRDSISPNALIFLPYPQVVYGNNFCYKGESNDMEAAGNIVLTDCLPFYTPYEVKVSAANYAEYRRNLSHRNGKVKRATLMLPFTMSLNDSAQKVSLNGAGTTDTLCVVNIYELKENCLSIDASKIGSSDNYGEHFDIEFGPAAKTSDNLAYPNYPYLVDVEKYPDTIKDSSFLIREYAATIYLRSENFSSSSANSTSETTGRGVTTSSTAPTTGTTTSTSYETYKTQYVRGDDRTGYIYTVDETTGEKTTNATTFTSYGGYTGEKLTVSQDGEQFYYFAGNRFFASSNLDGGYVYNYPFRGYFYVSSTSSGGGSLATIAKELNIVFSHGDDIVINESTTGVQEVNKDANGPMTVYNVQGMLLYKGDSKALSELGLQQGVYVVNGKKVMVK